MQGKTLRDGNLINCEISIYSSLRNLLFPEENAITIELTLNQHQLKLIKIYFKCQVGHMLRYQQ